MKIEETVGYMSSMYLERILRSYTQDYPKKGESEYRRLLINNSEVLSDPENIKSRLDDFFVENKDPYAKQILYTLVLKVLLSKDQKLASESSIIEEVTNAEESIIQQAKDSDSFKHIEETSKKIMEAILEVALEDDVISKDEFALIKKLRNKLSINEKDQYLIQAGMECFPSRNNQKHTSGEIKSVIDDLQKCGIVFCCNQYDEVTETVYVIPEEIIPGVKKALDIELIESKFLLLLEKLQVKQLKSILSNVNLYVSGTKEELIKRIVQAGINPSDILNDLTTNELSAICATLPGVNVSGVKEDKIKRIVDYFSKLIVKEISPEEDPREKYYEYLEELAGRDLKNLLGNKIITKSNHIENGFEKGTRYLFEKKLNLGLVTFEGVEHADGAVKFEKSNNILLWDNKSKEENTTYDFPDKHYRQFLRYIRLEAGRGNRVGCFLIITSSIDNNAIKNAMKLKAGSGQDTDIALITAENLKMLADDWKNHSVKDSFNLQILNYTGILDRETLKTRMKNLS